MSRIDWRERWQGLKCRRIWFFNHKIKTKMNKNHPEGEKQTGSELCTLHIHTQHKTMDQHKTADTRMLNRVTNEGNEGDTGGATETMTRWEGADNRQESTWHQQQTTSHVLITETSSGQPGHTSSTMTQH